MDRPGASSSPPSGLADTSRAVAFSDGVFAIIITLLVLELRPPETQRGHLLEGLLAQWPSYVAYATSYLFVAVVWLNHKASFKRIRFIDRGLHWANLSILFTTGLIPFPTAVLARTVREANPVDGPVAVALYALVGVLLCLAWLGFYHYLGGHPHLLHEEGRDRFFRRERTRPLAGIALYVVAGVIGHFAPAVALAFFFGLAAFYGITSEGLFEAPEDSRPSGTPPASDRTGPNATSFTT